MRSEAPHCQSLAGKPMKNNSHVTLPIGRYHMASRQLESADDEVVVEQPITVRVDAVGSFTLLCSPIEIKELAVGFLFTEGLIESIDDIINISDYDPNAQSISIHIEHSDSLKTNRHFLITSSCGFCGKRNIDTLFEAISPCQKTSLECLDKLDAIFTQFTRSQTLFKKTGGAHGAALFDGKGHIVTQSEDIGRHNAVDKIIGKRLLEKRDFKNVGLALSGRVSFELVVKAARARIGLIAAISAPTSLAVLAAKRWNITLYGFIRSGRVNIYHGSRL